MGTPSAAVTVEDLRVRYRGATADAVAGVTFHVTTGEVFGLLGPNGSGKSTTQRVLTRLLRSFSGRVEVLGRTLTGWGADYYERIGVGFEQPAAFTRLTGRENLHAFARLHRRPTRDVDELLAALGLDAAADRQVRTWSKGMRVRLDLARALLHHPDLLFLDEPTSGLDPVQRGAVHDLIRATAAEGTTVLLTTHDMDAAERLCDRVAFLSRGRLAALGTPHDLLHRQGAPLATVRYREGDAVRVERLTTDDPRLADLVRRVPVQSVHTDDPSLTDVFAAVTGGAR